MVTTILAGEILTKDFRWINENDTVSKALSMFEDTDELIVSINKMLEKKFDITHTTIQIEKKRMCDSDEICNR